MDRPKPITVKLADGTSRLMYETDGVDRYCVAASLKISQLGREVERLKLEGLRP